MRVVAAAALLAVGCGDSKPPIDPIAPIVAQPGRINITVLASGGDTDNDGFQAVVAAGTSRSTISVLTHAARDFVAGAYTVTLEGVAANCDVTSANPATVTVVSGAVTQVVFTILCHTTGIEIIARTSGFDVPANYQILINNPPAQLIPPNGSLLASRLGPGQHTVTLEPAINCSVVGAKSVTVQVANRTVIPVTFEVACGDLIRLEKIAFTRHLPGQSGARFVSVVLPDGTSPAELIAGHSPAWSRDGKKIVFSTFVECMGGWYDYYYDDCGGSLMLVDPETRVVSTVPDAFSATEPAWSPVADEIVFVRCCDIADERRLYVMRMDGPASGSAAVPLIFQSAVFPVVHLAKNPTWSPDGQRIAFTCMVEPANRDICIVNRSGSGLIRLTTGPGAEAQPAWSPDGNSIAFTRNDGGTMTVAIVPANGGAITNVALGANPSWSRDGKKLVFELQGLSTVNIDGSGLVQLVPPIAYEAAWRP